MNQHPRCQPLHLAAGKLASAQANNIEQLQASLELLNCLIKPIGPILAGGQLFKSLKRKQNLTATTETLFTGGN